MSLESYQVKTRSMSRDFPDVFQTGQTVTILWGWSFLRISNFILTPPQAVMWLVSVASMVLRLLVFKATTELERVIGTGQVKT